MKTARLACVVVAASAAALVAACVPAEPRPDPPSGIVLIVVDTLRADHLPDYGYSVDTAPRFSAAARQGALFERVIAPSSWTKTSMASIVTGRDPDRHGVRGVEDALADDLITLAEVLASGGYTTIGVNTNPWLQSEFGFSAGFDDYQSYVRPRLRESVFAVAVEVNRVALALLDDHPEEPFFLSLHYMDVHAPYHSDPARIGEQFLDVPGHGRMSNAMLELAYRKEGLDGPGVRERVVRLYDAGITETDEAIGELLDALRRRGRLDDTLVVITSDHGEGFREHGTAEHGWNLYPEVYEVPLALIWPGRIPPGTRVPQQVRSIDIAPTILDLADIEIPESFEGASLLPIGGKELRDRIALCNVGLNDYVPDLDFVAVVSPDHLYIRERVHGTTEFYDLRSDPGSLHDLGGEHPAAAAHAALAGESGARSLEKTTVDPETRERLESLGYLK